MTALATRPEDLRLAARELLVAQAGLEELAARVARSGATSAAGWQGVAALGQQAATERVRAAVLARCLPLGEVARSLDRLADQSERAGVVVRAAERAREEARVDRARQIALLATTVEPLEHQVIRERITLLDSVIHRAQDEIDRAEALLEQGRQVADRVLLNSWVGIGLDDLSDLVAAGKAFVPGWRGGGLVLVGTRLLLTSAKLSRELNPFVRFMTEARLDKLFKVVMKRPVVFLLTGAPARFVIPVVVISDAWPDVQDGGGYDGWRGVTLRVTAALAIPGSIAMVMPHPVVAGVGAVTVGAYYLVKSGNLIYDHRVVLSGVAKAAWGRRREIVRVAEKVLQPHEAFPLGPLGPMVPIGHTRDLLPELPRLEDLGRFLPGIGGPITLPSVPIERGPRLPVIPPPSLGVVGAGILLPSLGKLF